MSRDRDGAATRPNPTLTEVPNQLEPLLNERRAAEQLGVSPRALQAWRYRGGGPDFVRISRRAIRYRASDLEDWV